MWKKLILSAAMTKHWWWFAKCFHTIQLNVESQNIDVRVLEIHNRTSTKYVVYKNSYFKIIWIKQNMLYSVLKLKFAFGISQPNLQKYLLRELSSDNIIIFCPTSWIDTHTRNLPIKQIVYVYIISSNIKYLFRLLFI